jgi:S-adenosylmethionine-diacylglycerol 3-amino-3-carboxypropyl transferase
VLQQRVGRIATHTTTLSQFLQENPGQYTHFVLLDHQDWLARNDQQALGEEWELILQNSAPEAKVLLRSAAKEVTFIPDFARQNLRFEHEKTAEWHQKDRVGTYASVHLGIRV